MATKKKTLRKKTTSNCSIKQHHNDQYVKAKIDDTQEKSKRKFCDDRDDTINHIRECRKLAQRECKTRHHLLEIVIHMSSYASQGSWL